MLSSNDDKSYKYSIKLLQFYMKQTHFKVCEIEMISKIYMINFDDFTNENKIQHNLKWPYIPDHSYRILIIGSSRS